VTLPIQHIKSIPPKALQRGDKIAIISPAGPTPMGAHDPFEKGVTILREAGFEGVLMPHVRAMAENGYLAGRDEEKVADLHAAFQNPEIKAIIAARGGYGCMRLLSRLDFQVIGQHPKILVGFSDLTALLNPVYQTCGLVSFYGPMLTANLLNPNEDFSRTALFDMLQGKIGVGDALPNQDTYYCLQPGLAEGRLVGGNLSLLAALCGTPYQVQTGGCILFIEDWKESYYSLDRQFQQLKMAGMLDNIAGLLLCDFSAIDPGDATMPFPAFLQALLSPLLPPHLPAGYGFSVGHGHLTGTFPIGCLVQFDAVSGRVLLLEKPVG